MGLISLAINTRRSKMVYMKKFWANSSIKMSSFCLREWTKPLVRCFLGADFAYFIGQDDFAKAYVLGMRCE